MHMGFCWSQLKKAFLSKKKNAYETNVLEGHNNNPMLYFFLSLTDSIICMDLVVHNLYPLIFITISL